MKGWIQTMSGVVIPNWIDDNGHMNVASYMAIFDQGMNELLQQSGLISSENRRDLTVVAGRIYIEHRKELLEGEQWTLWSGFSVVQPTFVSVTHRLRSGGGICAVCDIRGAAFSKNTRTAISFATESLAFAQSLLVPGLVSRL